MRHAAERFALSRGIAQESSIARDEALDSLDPIVRALARRRIAKWLRRAELLTASPDPIHRMRLAYLLAAAHDVTAPDDVVATRAAVDALPAPASAGQKGPWLVGLLLGATLMCAGTALGLRAYFKPIRLESSPAGKIIASDLTRFVVAVGQGDAQAQQELVTSMTGPAASQALGVRGANQLLALLRSMQALHTGKGSDPVPLIEAFKNRTLAFDKALEDIKLPFFVDSDTFTTKEWPEPIARSYYIQRESRAVSGASRVRVLQLWRLDRLNVRQTVLGYTRPNTPAAIVLLDQVESDLVRFTLPAASPGGTLDLVDDLSRGRGEAWVTEVEQRASERVGAYYRASGAFSEPAARLGKLLQRRKELLKKWDASLRGQGLELNVPKRLFAPPSYTEQLGLRVPRADREEWDSIEAELRERLPDFEALRDRFVRGVERHEIQHRIDYGRGLIPVPASLCSWLGVTNPLDAPAGGLAARARDEESAYLAELGRDDDSPLLDLVILSNFVLNRETRNPPYTYAALAAYAAMGKALGIDVDTVLGRSISRQNFAKLAVLLWERPPEELRKAARRAYAAEFGAEWATVTREAGHENPRYRPEPY
jgi:hypothetical protein